MVCLGNICRSPLAEGILKSKITTSNTIIDSAGTGAWHSGEAPDIRSIKIAADNGINISNQKARQITLSDLDDFDLIYVMDKSNYKNVINLCQNDIQKKKVKLILNEITENNSEVPDPYYGEGDGFINVYNLLNSACEEIIKKYNL